MQNFTDWRDAVAPASNRAWLEANPPPPCVPGVPVYQSYIAPREGRSEAESVREHHHATPHPLALVGWFKLMATSGHNLIETGIYTVAEAAFLLGVSERRVRGWVSGYSGRDSAPIIQNELGWMDDRLALSFRNLMEMRFIVYFEREGVSFSRIRQVMDEVRAVTTHPHPFATNIVFRTDGVRVVGEVINKFSGIDIYDLATKNFEIVPLLYRSLKNDVRYDFNGEAVYWVPRPDTAPNVIVHPKFAFGKPIVRSSRIPTRALADAAESEGDLASVADAFERPLEEVREAVCFEAALRGAA